MALLSDIRRVFRSQARVRNMTRELHEINTHLSVIAKALQTIVIREYGIDVLAPPVAAQAPESELTVTYVNDYDQAIREEQERLEREFGATPDDRTELEKLLDEV